MIIEDSRQSYSTGFANKNNSPAPQIKYSKKINGTYYVVETAFENRYNKLWVQSAYLSKNREDVTQVPDAADKPSEVTAKTDLPSPSSKASLSHDGENVNNDYIAKEANSQGENASFFDEHFEKSTPKINPDEVISGMWEDSPNSSKNNVEKSQLESVENVDENGIIEETRILTLDDLIKDVLKTKPPNSRIPKDWIMAGGKISIDKNGNWIYTDWFGNSVKYIDGYPDYKGAGAVVQEVDIGGFISRGIDKRLADKLAPNGPHKKGNVWHHSQDGRTMQEVDVEIHRRFTHKGGYSLIKRKE